MQSDSGNVRLYSCAQDMQPQYTHGVCSMVLRGSNVSCLGRVVCSAGLEKERDSPASAQRTRVAVMPAQAPALSRAGTLSLPSRSENARFSTSYE